jgi:hypothetical protein
LTERKDVEDVVKALFAETYPPNSTMHLAMETFGIGDILYRVFEKGYRLGSYPQRGLCPDCGQPMQRKSEDWHCPECSVAWRREKP